MRYPKVPYFDMRTIDRPKEVGGFDIAVYDTLVVKILKTEKSIANDASGLANSKDGIAVIVPPLDLAAP